MAKFNPNEATLSQRQPNGAKFDASQAVLASSGKETKSARDRLLEGMQQRMLSTEDFGSGLQAGIQNLGAFATSPLPQSMQIPRYDPQPTSSYGQSPIEAGKIVSSLISGMGAEKAVAGGLGAIKQIPAWISRVAGGSAGGAVSAPGVDASPTTGAALGVAGSAIPEAAKGLMGRYLGKNVTPEQFESARQAIPENVRAPIGELADSPAAQQSYAASQASVLSGAEKPYNQLYDHLTKGVDSLTEGAPKTSTPNQDLYDEMNKKYGELKKNTSNAYDDFSAYADKNKIPINRGEYDKYLDNSINKINKEIEESPTSKDIHKDTLEILEKFKKDKIDNFSQAARQRKNIGVKIKQKLSEEKSYDDTLLLGAKKALDKSMEKSSLVNDEALNKYLTAKNARIEQGKMERLNDKDKTPFYKIWLKHGEPENLIGSYIKTGKNKDYSSLLSNMTNYLSEDGKNILANAHINPKEDMSLAKKIKQINDLSPKQRDLLFGEKAPIANNLSKISNIYGEAKVANFTPKTGWTGGKRLQAITELLAGIGGASAFGAPHSAAIVAAGAIPALGRGTQMALRSEWMKNAHMRYLQRAGKGALTKATPTGQALRSYLLSELGGNQNGA